MKKKYLGIWKLLSETRNTDYKLNAMQLQPSEYNVFLCKYISQVESKPMQIALLEAGNSLLDELQKISEKDSLFRYALGK